MLAKENIPIKFTYEGKYYEGYFSPHEAATGFEFQVIFNSYYQGMLRYRFEDESWKFYTTTPSFEKLAYWFGEYIIAWVE